MPRAALALVGLVVLAGCTGGPRPRPEQPPEPAAVLQKDALGVRAAELASQMVGIPYRFGGSAPDGFDCSGLVWYVYRELGVSVPRTAALQRAAATPVPGEALRPGDLVFFYTPADHVGLYLGGGEFVHAPATGRSVERARLDAPTFILGFAGAGRIAAR